MDKAKKKRTAAVYQFEGKNGYIYLYHNGVLIKDGIKRDTPKMRKNLVKIGWEDRYGD